jgi:hypothetical protein
MIRKDVRGVVEYNDGEFAEIQTVGIEGIEKALLLCKIQLHREDTDDSRQEFQSRTLFAAKKKPLISCCNNDSS